MNRQTQQLIVTISMVAGISLLAILGFFYFSQNQYKKYQNDQYKFSIKYPIEWTVSGNLNGAVVIFFSPLENELDIFQDSLNIVVQDLSKDPISLHDYTEKAIYQMKAVFKDNLEVLDSSPTTVAGHAAHRFVFKGRKAEVPLQYMCVWFIDGYKAYQLTYTTFASKYDLAISKVKFMVNSFRLL